MRNEKITPLYERLSRDDELQGESKLHKPSVSDLSRVFPPEKHTFEREGLKPLLATIKH